jgi:hypothetical protein
MQLSHAPPGRSAGNVGLIGSQRGRGRGAVSQSWTTVSLVLVACVTFLAGYFLGGSGGLGGLGGRGGRGQGFESPPKASTSTSTSWSIGDHHESSRGHNQGLHADALHLDDKSSASIARSNRKNQGNVTFEEIIAESGALRDYPPLTDIGLTGHPFYTVQPMQLLSWHPRAYLFPKFIDRDMAQHVIDLAASRLAPSGGYYYYCIELWPAPCAPTLSLAHSLTRSLSLALSLSLARQAWPSARETRWTRRSRFGPRRARS